LPFSKVLVSSGESRLFFWRLSEAISVSSPSARFP
jgi:hypothetical protein